MGDDVKERFRNEDLWGRLENDMGSVRLTRVTLALSKPYLQHPALPPATPTANGPMLNLSIKIPNTVPCPICASPYCQTRALSGISFARLST